jgi:hypothetical protein
MTKKQKGGKVIASGGFGCIFKPALKCENSDNRENNKVSKLMTVKYASEEYKQIQQFKTVFKSIPNYENYFLLDNFTLCKPAKLTNNDLDNYKQKCKALKKKNITSKNINTSLDKILSLNMPDGGIDIEKYIEEYFIGSGSGSNIIKLNNSLIDLLVNGIVPMNKLNVYHGDIKDSNVLVKIDDSSCKTRLIDWGLSFIRKNNSDIPRKLYRRPFQYNVPFSSVLFNNEFLKQYYKFLEINPSPDYFQMREFVINYIFIWNEIRGSGHLSAINDIIKKLTIKDLIAVKKNRIKEHLVEYDFTYYYIIEYLSKILEKYTQNGKLELMTYFNTVFLKNNDIWGFTMIYISLYEHLYKSFETLNEYQIQFITKIKYIIIHYLYETPVVPINVSSLVDELTKLNQLIENFDINNPSKKIEYLSDLREEVISKNESGGKSNIPKTKKSIKNKSKYNSKTRKNK